MARRIYFKFKKSFLKEQGLTKEGMEKCLAILAKDLRRMSKELRKSYCIDEEENKNIAKAFKENDFASFKKRAIACLRKRNRKIKTLQKHLQWQK